MRLLLCLSHRITTGRPTCGAASLHRRSTRRAWGAPRAAHIVRCAEPVGESHWAGAQHPRYAMHSLICRGPRRKHGKGGPVKHGWRVNSISTNGVQICVMWRQSTKSQETKARKQSKTMYRSRHQKKPKVSTVPEGSHGMKKKNYTGLAYVNEKPLPAWRDTPRGACLVGRCDRARPMQEIDE